MKGASIKALLIEDNPGDVRLIREALIEVKGPQTHLTDVGRLDEGLKQLDCHEYDVLLLDLMLPDSEGLDTFIKAHRHAPKIPIVLLTGQGDEALGIEAIRCGAQDYLIKGKVDGDLLVRSMRYAVERRRMEHALRESEERFRSITENAADAIVVTDRDGSVLYWNRSAEIIFGYSQDDILGKPMTLLLPEQQIDLYEETIAHFDSIETSDLKSKSLELDGLKKDGDEFPLALSLASWSAGEEYFYSVIIRDMTEAREIQKRFQLQDRLAAMGQLAAGIAHDFNNIVGTITLYTELLREARGLTLKDHERLTVIHEQARRASSLIGQILDFSRRAVMEKRSMNIVPFLREILKMLKRTLPSSIRIELIGDQDEYFISADPTRIQQLFTNLALNARDAMPDGGILRFELCQTQSQPGGSSPTLDLPPGKWLQIIVSDSGSGIAAEVLPHIFEPFFTTKPHGEGTGLGLAQVYGIVKQHDGYTDVKSEVGEGTTLTIYFPSIEVKEKPAPTKKMRSIHIGHGEIILVVEDDNTTRQALGEVLESLGYQFLLAANGEEAIELLEKQAEEIDLVISDLVMPLKGGAPLYEEMRVLCPQVPILIMTGHPVSSNTQKLLQEDNVTWIHKPMTTESLAEAMQNALIKKELDIGIRA